MPATFETDSYSPMLLDDTLNFSPLYNYGVVFHIYQWMELKHRVYSPAAAGHFKGFSVLATCMSLN